VLDQFLDRHRHSPFVDKGRTVTPHYTVKSRQPISCVAPAVTCVYSYQDLDEAIAAANSLPVAFQASVFAQDIGIALHAAERLDASAVMINDSTAFRTDWMPFAGRHQSGYGTGGIPFTMRDMTEEKMIVLRRS
jgi:acyl-CoA reductase-like NAD-dependent aldehyde dehydrogenase